MGKNEDMDISASFSSPLCTLKQISCMVSTEFSVVIALIKAPSIIVGEIHIWNPPDTHDILPFSLSLFSLLSLSNTVFLICSNALTFDNERTVG
jgi:hypothetical protein